MEYKYANVVLLLGDVRRVGVVFFVFCSSRNSRDRRVLGEQTVGHKSGSSQASSPVDWGLRHVLCEHGRRRLEWPIFENVTGGAF